VSPDGITLTPGAKRRFGALGRYSDGGTGPLTATWSATGGAIDQSGLFTAGSVAGRYSVMARASTGGVADTAIVTISQRAPSSPPPPPPNPPPPTGSGLWLNEDFSRYTSVAHYRSNPFSWNVVGASWFHQDQLALDPAEGYGGSRQSLR